jgi:N-ethylmaleimide reductase
MNKLFEPFDFFGLHFTSRVVMAPMTRCRSSQPGNVPNDLMAEYYGQRTSAALIISEATHVSQQGQGYSFTPGIHSQEQLSGWKKITARVHQNGGQMFCQLWHVGRMSHSMFQNGESPVAPSAISVPAGTSVWVHDGKEGKMVPCTPPRALSLNEISGIQDDFVNAAKNAKAAGFDGIEIHGANGYLIDEFLRTTSNQRTDQYGGSPENRIRFLIGLIDKLRDVYPAHRTGVRFSPHNTSRGMNDPQAPDTVLKAIRQLNDMGIGYIHFAEADWDEAPEIPVGFRLEARRTFSGLIIVAGKYEKARAKKILNERLADLVAFGRPFVANPDLPVRMKHNLSFAELKPDLLYGGDALGYTDYPSWSPNARRKSAVCERG